MSTVCIEVLVAGIRHEADGILSVELTNPNGGDLPPFTAGSHLDVYLPNGIIRPYSICNSERERHRYVLGVLKSEASRGGSAWVHSRLACGDRVTVAMPRNMFSLVDSAQHSILVAGGIGVTPLISMSHKLRNGNKSFEFRYCARSYTRAAFARTLQSELGPNFRLHLDDNPATAFDARADLGHWNAGYHLYVCGPAGFIEWVLQAANAGGWPSENVHVELFTPLSNIVVGDQPFDVVVASSGLRIRVESGSTILEALASAHVHIPFSCEQGVCGTCLTGVIDGTPDHRDGFLSEDERRSGKCIITCCSRSKSVSLTLDL